MVAERCGVGVMTVSRAMRNDPLVAQQTAARIHDVAREMGYNPAHHQNARQMVLRQHGLTSLNRLIGLFFPPLFYQSDTVDYFGPIYDSIMTVAMFERFGVLTSYVSYPFSETEYVPYLPLDSLPTIFAQGVVDGALLFGDSREEQRIIAMLRQEINFTERPVVTLLSPVAGCSCVLTDDETGAYAAMTHLLNLGHRQFLHLLHDEHKFYSYAIRLQGYHRALQAHGLNATRHLHCCAWDWDNPSHSTAELLNYLRAHPEITAILTPNDPIAIILYEALTTRGIVVPDQLSLVGHDDTGRIADGQGHNMLTTVRMPLAELGREAACLLIRQAKEHCAEPVTLTLPTSLVLRATTAPPPATHSHQRQ